MNRFLKLITTIAIICTCQISFAQNPSSNNLEGSKTYAAGIDIGECRINIITAGYKVDRLNDEQSTVYSNIKWKGRDLNSTCLSNEKFGIFLSIGNDSIPRYIYAGNSENLTVSPGNNEWGIHPFSATVSWDKFITKNFGADNRLQFVGRDEARNIMRQGATVSSVKIVTSKGKVFILK